MYAKLVYVWRPLAQRPCRKHHKLSLAVKQIRGTLELVYVHSKTHGNVCYS